MEGKERFIKYLSLRCKRECNLSNEDNALKMAMYEVFEHYEETSKTISKLFKEREGWDNDGHIVLLENLFLDDDKIEKKVRMKDKDKYRSILIWLMDNIDDTNTNIVGMISRAIGLFGSLLGSIKSKKTKKGTFEHRIMCHDWESEY